MKCNCGRAFELGRAHKIWVGGVAKLWVCDCCLETIRKSVGMDWVEPLSKKELGLEMARIAIADAERGQ